METRIFHLDDGQEIAYFKLKNVSHRELDRTAMALAQYYENWKPEEFLLTLIDASDPSIVLTEHVKHLAQTKLSKMPSLMGAVAIVINKSITTTGLRLYLKQILHLDKSPRHYKLFSTVDDAKQWLIEESQHDINNTDKSSYNFNATPYALIVEDDPRTNNLFAKILMKEGFKYRTVHRGDHALDMLKTYQPHVILLDIFLPGANGFEILEFINRSPNLEHAKVIAVSASVSVFETLDAGAHHAFHKPVSPRVLSELLKDIKLDNYQF